MLCQNSQLLAIGGQLRTRRQWPPTCRADPAALLRVDADVREPSACQKVRVLGGGQMGGTEQRHHCVIQRVRLPITRGLRNQCEGAARFEHAQDLANIRVQIRPVVVRFNGSDKIEGLVSEWQRGDGREFDLHAVRRDGFGVRPARRADACRGVVDAPHASLGRERHELLHRPSPSAADIEHHVVAFDAHVRQPPVGQSRVRDVHRAHESCAERAARLATLAEEPDDERHSDDEGDQPAHDWPI